MWEAPGAGSLSAAPGATSAGLRRRFYRGLRPHGLSQVTFAKRAGIGRSHLSQVLSGARPGGLTLPKLYRQVELIAPELVPVLEQLVPRGALRPGAVGERSAA